MNTWHIPSNNGWKTIKFEALPLNTATNEVEFRVEVMGRYTCGQEQFTSQHSDANNDDFRIVLPSVFIPKSACVELLNDFDDWLDTNSPFTCELHSGLDQVVIVQLDERDDLITAPDRPAITFFVQVAGCRLEIFFVVDQSCVRIARDGLSAVIQSYFDK